ncbi:MAG: hypothetical protein ABW185_21945, partial [Sedimenticola sp.]
PVIKYDGTLGGLKISFIFDLKAESVFISRILAGAPNGHMGVIGGRRAIFGLTLWVSSITPK